MTQQFTEPRDYDVFIGIDVDKRSFALTAVDHGNMKKSCKLPSDPEQLVQTIEHRYAGQRVLCVYEAGPTGYHLYDYLKKQNKPCLIVSPSSVPKPPNQRVKTNRIDSEKLAVELRSGKLTPIRVPEGPYRELRHLTTARANYARSRMIAKQRIKGLLLFSHLSSGLPDDSDNWSQRHVQALKQLQCTPAERYRLDLLLADLEHAREQTMTVLKQLKRFCLDHQEIDRHRGYLQSLPGIGFITAMTVLSRIGDPCNLKNVRELGAFLGLVPTEHSTGDTVSRGSITHLGNRTARSLLIETSWVAIRLDAELAQFYNRIKQRHHPKVAARKAIVAVARKLTARIYCVLKEQRNYQIH
jgi:transposase